MLHELNKQLKLSREKSWYIRNKIIALAILDFMSISQTITIDFNIPSTPSWNKLERKIEDNYINITNTEQLSFNLFLEENNFCQIKSLTSMYWPRFWGTTYQTPKEPFINSLIKYCILDSKSYSSQILCSPSSLQYAKLMIRKPWSHK